MKLEELASKAQVILLEELSALGVDFDHAEARVYEQRSVGVMGDGRSYEHIAEVEVRKGGAVVWNEILLGRLSRIPNEVRGVNRVAFVLV